VGKKRLSRSRRQIYLQIVAATVILACGIVIGSGAALLHFKDDIVPNRLPPSREIVRDMRTRYHLTDEQAKQVEAALAASRERMRTFFEGMREKMEAEFKELSSAMKDILTPEQFERWENDFKDRRRRGPGRFGGRQGPGGPGPGGRPGGFGRPGPGGGRSGPGRARPDGKPGQRRPEHRDFGPRPRRPAEPNSQETRPPAEPNSQVE
jgi:hypothetical protein